MNITLDASKNDPANELEPTRGMLADLEQQVARATTAAPILNEHLETLAAQAAAADRQVAALEGELISARERLVLRENENYSLQTSLDLVVSENSRLSRRLKENDATVDKT